MGCRTRALRQGSKGKADMMKRLVGLALCAVAGATAAQDSATVTAAGLERFEGGRIELGFSDPRIETGFEVLSSARVRDGGATLTFPLAEPLQVEVKLQAGSSTEGFRAQGIAEPGARHEVAWNARQNALEYSGGRYDDLIKLALAEPEETRTLALRQIYLNDSDPRARLMALQAGWREGQDAEQMAVLAELESLLGDGLVIDLLKVAAEQRDVERARAIQDYSAFDLAGEEVRFADVLAANKFTLVEFWASWCAPCIVEIPNLKAAYARFGERGFEILAFNLDDDREDWRQASEDDYSIPWLDVSDDLSFDSPFAKLYGVDAIPASFLLNSEGRTVGRNLHGAALEARLEELLAMETEPGSLSAP